MASILDRFGSYVQDQSGAAQLYRLALEEKRREQRRKREEYQGLLMPDPEELEPGLGLSTPFLDVLGGGKVLGLLGRAAQKAVPLGSEVVKRTVPRSNVVKFPEARWKATNPQDDIVDLLEDRVRLNNFNKTMPKDVADEFEGVRNVSNYVETAADKIGERVRFSKYLDMIRPQMVRDGLVDPEDQARAALRFYSRKRDEVDMLWAKELSGGELGNKLRVSLNEWREMTFGKSMQEIKDIYLTLKRKL